MLCAQFLLRKRDVPETEVLPLPCRSWNCQYCAPQRRRQLMAQAAAGEPNKLLTLTVNVAHGETPAERRDLLHEAWRNLVKRIGRQFALEPARRWSLKTSRRTPEKESAIRRITAKTLAKEVQSVPYFAFLEKTKRGEPHLHILLRLPFVPQDWISEQMADLARSPVVWIEAIKGAKHAVAYVTKYVTKAPAQWGNKKRYWRSRNWMINQSDQDERPWRKADNVEVLRTSWASYSQQKVSQRWTFEYLDDGWIRLHRPGAHPDWERANPDLAARLNQASMPPPSPA